MSVVMVAITEMCLAIRDLMNWVSRTPKKMGEELKNQNISQIFCSMVNRAHQTAEIVSQVIKAPFKNHVGITLGEYIEEKRLIPEHKTMLDDLNLQEKFMDHVALPLLLKGQNVLIISHDPQLSNIVTIVCLDTVALRHGAWAELEPDGWPKQQHIHALSLK